MLLLIIYSRNSSEFLQVKAKQRLSSEVTNWSLQKQIETQREGEKMCIIIIPAGWDLSWQTSPCSVVSDLHFIKFTTGRQEIFSAGKISKFAECKVQIARSIRLIYRAPTECE